jgi:hypothetical protein
VFCDDSVVVIVDGHSIYLTRRVVVVAVSRKISILRLVARASHIGQSLAPCIFGVMKMIYTHERESKWLIGEIRE